MLKPRADTRDVIAIEFPFFSTALIKSKQWGTFYLHGCPVYGDLHLHEFIVDVPVTLFFYYFAEEIIE